MSNTYKDQFTEWSPAYPVVFHGNHTLCSENLFTLYDGWRIKTMKTHNITINAINKAMKK